jgi:hypothetical protein
VILNTYRVLRPSSDSKIFFEIMMDFKEYELNTPNRPYNKDDIEKKVSIYIDAFNEANLDKFIVVGEFKNDELVSIGVGYTYQFLWKSKHNALAHWVLGLVYSKEKKITIPTEKINTLSGLLSKEFEKLQFCSFYMITKSPKSLSYNNCSAYLENIINKTYKQDRYFCYLDRIIDSQEKIDNCRITSLTDILPKIYKKKMVIWQWFLKPEFKNENF